MRILTVFGTRPEAIKLAPVVRLLRDLRGIEHATCVTGQHRELLDPVLELFDIQPEFDLNLMKPGQDLTHVTSSVLAGAGNVFDRFQPDWSIVQGDTTTAFAAALAAFYRRVRVAHVEAGLRTGDIDAPWPEEMNRRLVSRIAMLHFAPTPRGAANLRAEGIDPESILVTGNTVVDALRWVDERIAGDMALRVRLDAPFDFLHTEKRLILVTGHRRESFDGGLHRVCLALRTIAGRGDVEVVYPLHLNPQVQQTARVLLADCPHVHLVAPQDYLSFVRLMQRAYLIVTDSGGVQEEAPGLAKPVLVTRDATERPEAVDAGAARLVGTDIAALVAATTELLDDPCAYAAMARITNPFGDGRAARRIVEKLTADW